MTYLRLSAIALTVLAAAALTWWVADMRGDLRQTRAELVTLRGDLKAEAERRQAEVDGLSNLVGGLAKNATLDQADREALSDAIDTKNPQPASAGLAALLRRLRAADQNGAEHATPGAR